MELSNLLKLTKKNTTPKYLAVEIGLESVRTASWEVINGQPSLLQVGSNEIVDTQNPELLLQGIDTSLTQAQIGVDPEPNEMILSLPEQWLVNNNIAADKKQILKYVADKLELKPVGFVVTLEAIIHYLEHQKGQPPNLIILYLSNEDVLVSIIKNGQILGTQVVGRSEDLGADVKEGLARFEEVKTLPAHMVIYDGSTDLEQLQQELIEYDWQTDLPFLHMPKIDRLRSEDVVKAVVLTGGTEVIKSAHLTPAVGESLDEEVVPQDDQDDSIPDLQEEFGFTVSHPDNQESGGSTPDLSEQITDADSNLLPADEFEMDLPSSPDDEEDFATTNRESLLSRLNPLSALTKLVSARSASPRIPGQRGWQLRLGIFLLVGSLLAVGAAASVAAAYWYLPQATVTLFVEPRIITRQINFVVDPNLGTLDTTNNQVPGVPYSTELTAQAQTAATGEKLVGDRATGRVTVYNRTDSVKNFEKGTQLTGSNGKTYTLDEDITIASASSKENANFSITTEPAKTEAKITAVAIGAEFNVAENTEFSIANFAKSSFVAVAIDSISGGTSRQATAVAQQDINDLRNQVNQEIEQKILTQINQSQQDFTAAIILADGSDDLEEDFSAQVGQEANSVSLETKTVVRTMTYKRADVAQLVQAAAGNEIPANYQLKSDDITIEVIENRETDDGAVVVDARVRIKVAPELNTQEIQTAIRGKFPHATEDYFRQQPGFSRVEIDIQPKFPERYRTFPKVADRITVEVTLTQEATP